MSRKTNSVWAEEFEDYAAELEGAFERSGNSATLSADTAAEGLGEREGFTFNFKIDTQQDAGKLRCGTGTGQVHSRDNRAIPAFPTCGRQDLPRPDAGWAPVIVGICSVLTCNPVIAIPALAIARQRDRE